MHRVSILLVAAIAAFAAPPAAGARTAPPVTTITSGPSGPTKSTTATYIFTASDPGSTFECKLTGPGVPGISEACTSPKSYAGLEDGDYAFAVRATDSLGTVETSPPVARFTVDTVAPTATITDHPAALTNETSWSFDFKSDDGMASFQCALDAPSHRGTLASCGSRRPSAG